ncbi:MAG: LPS export ABC transporter periplasmic protein LptC [Pseudomonadota bacterium]
MAREVSAYSRVVRGLKIGLPLLALALLSAIFLLPREHTFDGGLVYSDADLVALGEGLSVSNPRIEGATEAGEPFVVEAERATPDKPDPEEVELEQVRASYTQAEGREIRLQAKEGFLRPREGRLSLEGEVRLETSDGYRVETEAVSADLEAGSAEAPGPVRAEGPSGVIESGSFRARRVAGEGEDESLGGLSPGDYLWFEDGVRVRWSPQPSAE